MIVMRIPLDRQRDLYGQHAEAAVTALEQLLRERRHELIELGEGRAFEAVGVHEYGDSTYWLGEGRLAEEIEAELADAIFYMQVRLAREAGDLPPVSG